MPGFNKDDLLIAMVGTAVVTIAVIASVNLCWIAYCIKTLIVR